VSGNLPSSAVAALLESEDHELVFDRVVLSRLRAALGGNVRWSVSGGAPLGSRLNHFFRGIGINVIEGYGLT